MKLDEPLVEIFMATYNGEPYLSAQIDSIVNQSYRNWSLIIHDDGSSDATVAIISRYADQYPGQVCFLSDGIKCGGAKCNFAHLMAHASADYIMFADQDDVWLPSKVKDSLEGLMAHEAIKGKHVPLAVFTDLTVVDETLSVIAPSFWAFQSFKPRQQAGSLDELAIHNCVTGCTLLMNRSALSVCLPMLPVAVMHDWWCALKILQMQGALIPLTTPTVLYRQHSGNVVGARQWSIVVVLQKVLRFPRYRKDFMANYRMAKYFLPRCNIFSFFIRKMMVVLR